MAETDPDRIYDGITSVYGHYYVKNISKKNIKQNSNRYRREPWMTNEILKDIRRRDRLAKIKERRNEYKKLRNEIVTKTRKAEKEYLYKEISDSLGNIKKHWQLLRSSINKSNNKQDVTSDFLYRDIWITDDATNANYMNNCIA